MYEVVQDRRLLRHTLSLDMLTEADDDYDVYHLYHSRQPFVVVSGAEAFDSFELPLLIPEWQDQWYHAEASPPISPTYTMTSDFEFPNVTAEDIGMAGYSKLFRSGLLFTSQMITRQLASLIHAVRGRWHTRN